MRPAELIAEITTSLAALQLETNTTAQILAAVLAPLLRSSADPEREDLQGKQLKRPRKRAGRPRSRRAPRRRKYKRHAPTEARDAAVAAWRANPDATPTEIAKLAKVSRSTAVSARKRLAAEMRKEARHKSRAPATRRTANTANPSDRRQRAQRFLQDALAQGPKAIQAVEAAAAKAHIDDVVLTQARGDLGVIATRADSGGVHAVQWALPG